jgi:hypothetical protein
MLATISALASNPKNI